MTFIPLLYCASRIGVIRMSGSGSKSVPSEDELGEKWDRCIADTILKTGELNVIDLS